ncbi:MAG: hypothetical protein U9Q15_01340 [Patescibacteria group bacterium]|nr:hypothetical protein [Patescibacteria group bacterium]
MMELATQQLFEEAAKIKEQYQIIQEIEEKQKLEHVDTIARDII